MAMEGHKNGSCYNGWKWNDGAIIKRNDELTIKAGLQRIDMTMEGHENGSCYNGWKWNDEAIIKRNDELTIKAGLQRMEYDDERTRK